MRALFPPERTLESPSSESSLEVLSVPVSLLKLPFADTRRMSAAERSLFELGACTRLDINAK